MFLNKSCRKKKSCQTTTCMTKFTLLASVPLTNLVEKKNFLVWLFFARQPLSRRCCQRQASGQLNSPRQKKTENVDSRAKRKTRNFIFNKTSFGERNAREQSDALFTSCVSDFFSDFFRVTLPPRKTRNFIFNKQKR